MPLKGGYSKKTIKANIAECIENKGKDHKKQCVAMAYDKARKDFNKAHSDKPLPTYLRKVSKRK